MTQVIVFIGGEYRNRTGVHGFAIRCVTTPPTRRLWSGALLTDQLESCKTPHAGKYAKGSCCRDGDVAHLVERI